MFQFPLRLDEIFSRQVKINGMSFTRQHIVRAVKKAREIKEKDGFFYLHQNFSSQIVTQRKQREYWSSIKWRTEVQLLKKILENIPTIQEAYITGSLAVQNVHSLHDDIDVLIVARQNTLWLTRMLVIFFTAIIGKYRLHDTEGRNSWCFNLWLEPSSLTLPKGRRNLYTAYEIFQAKQIVGYNNSLLSRNVWITNFLTVDSSIFSRSEVEHKNTSFLITIINKLCYQFQFLYMATRRTSETVSLDRAFFHPQNAQVFVRKQFSFLRKKYQL